MLKSLISVSACVSRIAMQAAGKEDGKEDEVRALVAKHTEQRQLGFLGELRVNMMKLNLELNAIHPAY